MAAADSDSLNITNSIFTTILTIDQSITMAAADYDSLTIYHFHNKCCVRLKFDTIAGTAGGVGLNGVNSTFDV